MCEVLPVDQPKQSSYSLTDIESTPSSLDFCAAEDEMVSFQCGEPVELQDPCPISLTEEDSPSAFILEEKRNIYTPSKKDEHKREKPLELCSNSCDLMHRECSAPVLCSDTQVASLSEQGISFEDISPFGKQELSSLTARSGECSLTPDIILSPCGPSSSESSSSKPSSFSAFSRLAQKLSQDYLYGASAHVAHRCNTVSDELSLVPFQRGESVSISTSYSPRRFTSWYYSLTASYKTKLDQFRRIFRGTPVDTDRLLVDYSCALSKNNHGLLLQGRMYVTENWICFYSKILYEQKIYLAVKEIIGITKEKTARVIPNAIQIMYSKNHERFFFTSFASRERTFAILRKVWENCRNHQSFLQANQTMSIEEIMQQVREIYGDDSLAMLEDEDTDADPDLIQSSSAGRFGNISESSDFYSPLESGNGEQQPASTDAWQSDRGLSDNGFSEPRVRSSADDADDDERRTDSAPIERPHSALENPIGLSFSAPVESKGLLNEYSSLNFETTSLLQNRRRSRLRDQPDIGESIHTEPEFGAAELRTSSQTVKPERKKRSKKRRSHSNVPEPQSDLHKALSLSKSTKQLSEVDDPDFPVDCSPGHDHPGLLYADTEVPLSVDALFACIFTDSEFFDRLSTSRKTFDMVQSSWPPFNWSSLDQESSGAELAGNIERTICYTLTLRQRMGPRTCTAVEQQTLHVSESQPGRRYVVDAKVTNQAVPLCNCFCVVSRYCLLRTGRLTSRLRVYSRVVYEKPVFFGAKSIIENTCKSGLTDFFTALTSHLNDLSVGLSDEDRLTGGYLAARSTNTAISHEGMTKRGSKVREKFKEDNKLVTTRGRTNGSAIRRPSVVGELREPGHVVALSGSSSSSPVHGVPGKVPVGSGGSSAFLSPSHSKQNADLFQFILSPDRAWLLLAVIGLLLCLFLSMVYSRLVALEQLARHLSIPQPGPADQSESSGFQPELLLTPTGFQLSESTRNRIRSIKDITQGMSQTLIQMQQVMTKVQQSLEILESTYPVLGPKTNAEATASAIPSDCGQSSLPGVSCPVS